MPPVTNSDRVFGDIILDVFILIYFCSIGNELVDQQAKTSLLLEPTSFAASSFLLCLTTENFITKQEPHAMGNTNTKCTKSDVNIALVPTAAHATWWVFIIFSRPNLCPKFCCCSTQKLYISSGCLFTCAIYHHRETINFLIYIKGSSYF